MTATVAYPDELLDDAQVEEYYKNLHIDSGKYMDGYINIIQFFKNTSYNKLRRPTKNWIDQRAVLDINGFYHSLLNMISN